MTTIRPRPVTSSEIQQDSAITPLLQRIYAARGVHSSSELELTLSRLIFPDHLKNLSLATELLADSLANKQRILIVGDYDADGATSCALAVLALRAMGADWVDFLVPDRFQFGYGLSVDIVEVAYDHYRPDLIVTVDNGISSIEGVDRALALGIKVLITDHHLPGSELPKAHAIVNPNQDGCEFPSKHLAGVGVVFYTLSALRRYLIKQEWFQRQQIPIPNMAHYLDLVALGTVADVVPLDHNNRILISAGLGLIKANAARPGIYALLRLAGKDYKTTVASDLAFAVGPRLNAAGRLDDMSIGINTLLAKDMNQAMPLATQLNDYNQARKVIEASMKAEADQCISVMKQRQQDTMPYGICLFEKSWHQGVIGILASRIKERWHRPVIAFACADDGSEQLKGSARSVQGFHIRDALALINSQYPNLLIKFGGHAMAAGLTIRQTDYEQFSEIFADIAQSQLGDLALQQEILTDGQLSAEEFTLATALQLMAAGPWGHHFPEPLFEGEFEVLDSKILQDKHIKMKLCQQNNQPIDAIAFNVDFSVWPNRSSIYLAYRLSVNDYKGKQSVQLIIEHAQ